MNGIGHGRFGSGEVKFRCLLRIVTHPGLLEVLYGIVIDTLVYVEGFLGEKHGVE